MGLITSAIPVQIIGFARAMRGGSHSFLGYDIHGTHYVVKWVNNRQGTLILANELIATNILDELGLRSAPGRIVEVPRCLTDYLNTQFPEEYSGIEPGLHFGSVFLGQGPGTVYDWLPEKSVGSKHNGGVAAGALVFDNWVCNTDSRQFVYVRRPRHRKFRAFIVDNGHCFGGPIWKISDRPARGISQFADIYRSVCSWKIIEPWLSKVEAMTSDTLRRCTSDIPEQWTAGAPYQVEQLVELLMERRDSVRELVFETVKTFRRTLFPWAYEMADCDTINSHGRKSIKAPIGVFG